MHFQKLFKVQIIKEVTSTGFKQYNNYKILCYGYVVFMIGKSIQNFSGNCKASYLENK